MQSRAEERPSTAWPPSRDRDSSAFERGTPMKVNKKSALALGALIAGSMLALAGCAGGGGAARPSRPPTRSGTLTVWVDQTAPTRSRTSRRRSRTRPAFTVNLVVKDNAKIRRRLHSTGPDRQGPRHHDRRTRLARRVRAGRASSRPSSSATAGDFQTVAVSRCHVRRQGLRPALRDREHRAHAQHRRWPGGSRDVRRHDRRGHGRGHQVPVRRRPRPGERATRTTCTGSRPRSATRCSRRTPTARTTARSSRSATTPDSPSRTGSAAQGAAGTRQPQPDEDLAKEAFLAGETPFIITGPWNVTDAEAKGINIAIDPIPTAGGEAARRSSACRAST